jgi:hypothetical protein
MQRKDPPNDILIYRNAESQGDLLGNTRTSLSRIALLHIDNGARMTSGFGPFGSALGLRFGENSSRCFRWTRVRWKIYGVEGLKVIPNRRSRVGLIHTETDTKMAASLRRFAP